MLTKEIMEMQFGYNAWANGRILHQASLVTAEQFNQPSVVGERSLREILGHLALVERVWRLLADLGEFEPGQLPADEQLATVKAIRSVLAVEQEQMAVFLAGLNDEELAREMTIKRWDGIKIVMARWQMLQHLLLHSMQHRTEAAVLLTNLGRSPGDLDFLFFVTAD